jgi:hypothetical protein
LRGPMATCGCFGGVDCTPDPGMEYSLLSADGASYSV